MYRRLAEEKRKRKWRWTMMEGERADVSHCRDPKDRPGKVSRHADKVKAKKREEESRSRTEQEMEQADGGGDPRESRGRAAGAAK